MTDEELQNYEETINELNSQNSYLKDHVSELENNIERLRNEKYRIQQEKESLEYDLDDAKRKIRQLENENNSFKRGY